MLSDVWITQYKNKLLPLSRPTSHNKYPDIFDKFLAVTENKEDIEDKY